ncbi:DUF1150 family protein [Acetobacter musti]|uniref:DUF1150 family protein n=1 Tax=Acetobacter musti TaxID=864732 RepID=A0ABX0JJR3_9PROT|nr:DUF1150 family protein [Acetobacter musti]NHN83068.1 DUF1150 family protein [Acetobacter musti]
MQRNVTNGDDRTPQDRATQDAGAGVVDIRNLTDDQFLTLGLPKLVYVRENRSEGRNVFAIHAANGQIMGVAEDPETAFSAITEHEMVAMTIH